MRSRGRCDSAVVVWSTHRRAGHTVNRSRIRLRRTYCRRSVQMHFLHGRAHTELAARDQAPPAEVRPPE
jgi:hypothetical protein